MPFRLTPHDLEEEKPFLQSLALATRPSQKIKTASEKQLRLLYKMVAFVVLGVYVPKCQNFVHSAKQRSKLLKKMFQSKTHTKRAFASLSTEEMRKMLSKISFLLPKLMTCYFKVWPEPCGGNNQW